MSTIEKYLDKNRDQFAKLESMLDAGEIQMIVTSCELHNLLGNLEGSKWMPEEAKNTGDGMLYYKGAKVIMDINMSAGMLLPVMKENAILFNTACLCGIFSDEPHP